MPHFSIATQVDDELQDFRTARVKLASIADTHDDNVRFGKQKQNGYFFNQMEMITIIDLYYNSKFQNGLRDKLKQRKLFLNVGKFRCDIAEKQIVLQPRDFKFMPDAYADPFTAYFLQKDFHEWAKGRSDDDMDDASLGDLIDKLGGHFPRYGTIVVKKVGNTLRHVPLQNLRNEQSAKSLQTARYVIEEHDLYGSEIYEMAAEKGWYVGNEIFKFNKKYKVYERYGHVPSAWLQAVRKSQFNEEPDIVIPAASSKSEDTIAIFTTEAGRDGKGTHIFYANAIPEGRPYREKHWSRQHGRWLGIGVMEDLIENQEAKNIVINLQRRSLHWGSKRIGQSANAEIAGKNLVADVPDGTILEVGMGGQISMIDLSNKSLGEFQQTLGEWERNSDQKAFTYESNVMANGGTRTAFRLAAFLTQAAQAYFGKKREMLARFIRDAIDDFFIDQFLADMGNKERVVNLMSGERGFEALKAAAMQVVRTEAAKASMLSGKPVDAAGILAAIGPFQAARALFVTLPKNGYQNARYKFDFVGSDNDDLTDVQGEIKSLTMLYQAMAAVGDKRAEKVLERVAELSGINIDSFGTAETTAPANPPTDGTATPPATGLPNGMTRSPVQVAPTGPVPQR